ncbi:GMC family oxidoreductase [Bdellovibrionota bacterium FG-2]
MEYDFVIVGSGFGGSVSALRLAEKGYSVCILERGKRFRDEDFPKTNWDARRYLWLPLLKCFGIQKLTLFRNVFILSGAGVGGGSLVYANTLLKPSDDVFHSPSWKALADWKKELDPHYETAKKMLGVTKNPKLTYVDRVMQACAKELGREDTFHMTDVGVFFGEPGKEVPDPFFFGKGPMRKGCIHCGGCMVGCRHGAKNTLEKNYLYLAEKLGVKIIPEIDVVDVKPLSADGAQGYELVTEASTAWFFKNRASVKAKKVILAGGVLGTVDLLLRCKNISNSLPRLSDKLGDSIRTNSETLLGVTEPGATEDHDYSEGVAITSIFHPDDHTHIEPVRYPKGSSFMKLLAAPMTEGGIPWIRPFKLLWLMLLNPMMCFKLFANFKWANNTVILLVMQTLDNRMRFRLGRNLFTGFRKAMVTSPEPGSEPVPSYIPIGHKVARLFAKKVNGIPQSAVNEVLFNIPTTAHILGGCGIGASAKEGVVNPRHEVFGYQNMWVCDGSVIPANLGVNPSLTITAMTERAMSFFPNKNS